MTIILTILLAIIICIILHIMVMAFTGWFIGLPIERINLFVGPRIKQIKFKNTFIALHFIPIGGSIQFGDKLQKIHPIKKISIAISGCLSLFIFSIIVYGPFEAFYKFLSCFFQIINGTISPHSIGSSLLVELYKYASKSSFISILGLVDSKISAFNLLPLANINGGFIIIELVNWIKPINPRFLEIILLLSIILMIILSICWIIAFYFSLTFFVI